MALQSLPSLTLTYVHIRCVYTASGSIKQDITLNNLALAYVYLFTHHVIKASFKEVKKKKLKKS